MPIITTGSFAKALLPGIKVWFGQAYDEHVPEYLKCFAEESSDKAYEEYVGTTAFGLAAIKSEGASVVYDSMEQGFVTRLTNVAYALGFIITIEAVRDNQYDRDTKSKSKALAFSMRQTKEIVGANVYNRAFSSSYVGGDGVEMCSLLHPNKSGGYYANKMTTDADLSELALEQACIDIAKFTDDRGKKIAIRPLGILGPPDLEFEAGRILQSQLQNDSANNAINVIKANGKFPQGFTVNHYFTDTDAWFIRTNCMNGMVYQNREEFPVDTDNDFDTKNAKFIAAFRCAFGWVDPRGIYGSQGA